MKFDRALVIRTLCAVFGLSIAAGAWMSCSAPNRAASSGLGGGFGGGQSTASANGGHDSNSGGDGGGVIHVNDAGHCSTCKELDADCGPVTDPKCGSVIQCGKCPSGETCGGGGHFKCGKGSPDACSPLTCADQNISCGQAGDGCNGTLACGSCTLPQACGGDPAKKGKCGCTGVCAQIPDCSMSPTTTTLTGTVLDPAGVHPIANALVYIPNDPSDPGLEPFDAGITCDVCGATAAGSPLVSTQTLYNGTFTLNNVPVGASIPLVVQIGRWRRQFTVPITSSCMPNQVPGGTLKMPSNHNDGDIPRIAILTGALDPVECVLRKMGIIDTEFTNAGGGGHINFFLANGTGYGAHIGASSPPQSSLFALDGSGNPVINQYDMVILECEGYAQAESASDLAAIHAYAEAGGRVFASDFAYNWLWKNGNFAQAATWTASNGGYTAMPVSVDLVSNPEATVFDQWLEVVGVSAMGSDKITSIYPAFRNTSAVVAPTQQWLYWVYSGDGHTVPLHFAFNTPVGAPPANQCGRVVFSDWHAKQPTVAVRGAQFANECPDNTFSSQESILEYMLFDLSACVKPYTPLCTPETCGDQHIECGPAGDGCGGPLDCGVCMAPDTCGGGGPGKCGTMTNCTPLTCHGQGIECGQAGDGCGNTLNCGNCPTGQVCGLGGPGKCGSVN